METVDLFMASMMVRVFINTYLQNHQIVYINYAWLSVGQKRKIKLTPLTQNGILHFFFNSKNKERQGCSKSTEQCVHLAAELEEWDVFL